MLAVEFQADVRDGRIEVPEEHRGRFSKNVRVILLAEEPAEPDVPDAIETLLEHPLRLEGFVPLSRDEAHERR